MERISFIVDALNQPPFKKGISTMTEFDSKNGHELLEIISDIIITIDPEHEGIFKEPFEMKIRRIMSFLTVMKFNIPEDQYEDFQAMLMNYDKDLMHTVIHWALSRLEHLTKRAYLAKYLMPIDIPAEFLNEELIVELSQRLKELQMDFKEVHKNAEQVRATGIKPADLKAEIMQLEQEKTQLQNKIQKMKRDMSTDEDKFREMLKATSALRKEQENEVMTHERLRENRKIAQEIEMRFSDAQRRLSEMRSSGIQTHSADQILTQLNQDVRELNDRRENVERIIAERENHLEKLQGWDSNDRVTTEDDVRNKRDQVADLEDLLASLNQRMDEAMERNSKLVVPRQASALAMKKFRDREEEVDQLTDELRRLHRQIEERENEAREKNRAGGNQKISKKELKRYGAVVKEKIETYKRMRDELALLRSELVVLQRTETILKGRSQNLEQFLSDLEKQKGVEGYRDTQKALINMSEQTAEIDQMKGATLEEISSMVENISREFKNKQAQLQPLIAELKGVRQEYLDMESLYQEKRSNYEKIAVGLEMEKQSLEKECAQFQDECLREESRYHQTQNHIAILKIRLDRCDQERKFQSGSSRLMRDFASLKELYANKLGQQDQLTKQLRKRQKELKENSGALTNQKSNFSNLQLLLDAKVRLQNGENLNLNGEYTGVPVKAEVYPTAYAEPISYSNAGAKYEKDSFGDYY